MSCLVTLLLLLSACVDSRSIPVPAISFQESIDELKVKEKNVLFDEDISAGSPGTIHYDLRMKKFIYVSPRKDTLSYLFMKDRLFSTLITLYEADQASVIEDLEKNENVKPVKEKLFKWGDVFIHLGQENGKNVS